MARTFYTSTTASDLTSGGSFSNAFADAQEAASSITLSAAASSTDQGSYFTESGVPGTGGTSTGTFTIRTNIASAQSGVNFRVNLMRVNSAGTVQSTVLGTYAAASAGLRTQTFTNPALGTWATGDRLRVQYQIQNTNTMGGSRSLSFETGQLAQDTPFAAPASPQLVTPPTVSLTTAAFAPTVTVSNHKTVIPGVASLTTATFAPTVTATEGSAVTVIPGTASVSITTLAPTIEVTDHQSVSPPVASLSLAAFAPTVVASDHITATPLTAELSLTTFAPTLAADASITVTPGTASLTSSTFAPTVSTAINQSVVPTPASLSLATFIPSVTTTEDRLITPAISELVLTGLPPVVTASGGPSGSSVVNKRRTFRMHMPVILPPVMTEDDEDYFTVI